MAIVTGVGFAAGSGGVVPAVGAAAGIGSTSGRIKAIANLKGTAAATGAASGRERGKFNWIGNADLDWISTTTFVNVIERGFAKIAYSAEIHLRSLVSSAVVLPAPITRARGSAVGRGTGTAPEPIQLAAIVGTVPADFNMIESAQDFRAGFNGAPYDYTGDKPAWTQIAANIIASVAVAPDLASTAWKLNEDSSNTLHYLQVSGGARIGSGFNSYMQVQTMVGVVWRFACIAKAGERTRIVFGCDMGFAGFNPVSNVSGGFDLANGTVFDTAADSGWTVVGTSIIHVGNSWYLCIVDATSTHDPTLLRSPCPTIYLDAGSGAQPRNITYTGDGRSGANVWWMSMLPRGAWSLSQRAFFDDFDSLATIDVNDTRAPGYNWYTHNDWPNNSQFVYGGFSGWFRSAPTPAGYISVSSSKLTLSDDVSTYGSGLMTVAAPPSSPDLPGYAGTAVFQASFIMESRFAFDSSFVTFSVPAFWTAPTEELTGERVLGETYAEIDFLEAGAPGIGNPPSAPSTSLHSFVIGPSGGGASTHIIFGYFIGNNLADTLNQNRWGSLVLGPQDNDGVWGLKMPFYNGLFVHSTGGTDVHWSAIKSYTQIGGTTFPFGMWGEVNYQHYPIIIGAGQGRPITIDWVRVFNNPNAPPILYNSSVSMFGSTGTLTTHATQSGGTLYWIATTNSTTPTVAQIKAGQDASNATAIAHGLQTVAAIGTQSISITGFTPGLYTYILQDNGRVSNIDGTNKLPYVGPGDIVSGMAGWWSLRAISSASIGSNVIRLRESGGNTEQDFVSIYTGGLDLAAIAAFKGSNTLFVRKLYDQSGNGYDMGQAVQANQPIFTLNAFGDLPGITYVAATPTFLEVTSAPGNTAAATPPFAVSAVVKPTGIGSFVEGVYGTNGGSGVDISINISGTLVFNKSFVATILTSSGALANNVISDLMLSYNGTNSAFYIKGVASGIASIAQTFNTSNQVSLGVEAGFGGGKLNGIMPETGFWSTTRDATQSSNISANQRAYWGYS